jgi:protein MpaA
MNRRLGSALVALVVAAAGLGVPRAASASGGAGESAVIGQQVIGHSVVGRPLTAWHLGVAGEAPTVVLFAAMHGNEPAPSQILRTLRDGLPIRKVDLWVVPAYNPDGLARGSRKNAHGVDLNRNFPYDWADLDGSYESGPRPASEPETRAVMRFLRDVRPDYILSFHQPLNGVDTDMKSPRFARRVADKLNLPTQTLDCGGVCHGTMTAWYNHNFPGVAVTVEYPAHPGRRRMTKVAPAQVLSIFAARYGILDAIEAPGPGGR